MPTASWKNTRLFSARRAWALTALTALLMTGSPAHSGEYLRFKAETISTKALDSAAILANLGGRNSRRDESQGGRYFVVQFKSVITLQDRQNLQTLGAEILRYVPDDALVIRSSLRIARTIAISSPAVQVVLPFAANWKVSNEFSPSSIFNAKTTHQVLIRLFPGEDSRSVASKIVALGARIDDASGRSVVATLTQAMIDNVAAFDGVEWIQMNPEIRPFHVTGDDFSGLATTVSGDYKDLTGYESGTRLMNFDAAWKRGLTGKGQTVGMADTGLDRGDVKTIHSDFTGRVPQGFIFGLFSKSWDDPMGHGTHVAGSVLGSGSISGGLLKGGAYDAALIPEGMWSPMLNNLSVPSKLGDLFLKAYGVGARIHTNSWGSPANLGVYDAFAQQVDEFMSSHPDMLVVFAAGNSGVDADKDGRIDPGSVSSPGTAKNVLTVGASKNYVFNGGIQKKLIELKIGKENWGVEPLASSMLSENASGLAPFSSRGPTSDGRLKPEIVAPGTNILSTRSKHPNAETLWGVYNDEYVWSGGTSMATPLTAGAVAVVRQYLVENRNISNPSAALMKGVLMHSAKDLFPGQFGSVGKERGQELLTRRPNSDEGYGLVDLDRATDLAKAVLVDERAGLGAGETHTYPVHITGANSKLVATLVYTDAPAAAGAAKALVNDLDLMVVDSSGKVTTLNDHTNNAEMLELQVPAGDYEIRVKGMNVPQGMAAGKQAYALILSVN